MHGFSTIVVQPADSRAKYPLLLGRALEGRATKDEGLGTAFLYTSVETLQSYQGIPCVGSQLKYNSETVSSKAPVDARSDALNTAHF